MQHRGFADATVARCRLRMAISVSLLCAICSISRSAAAESGPRLRVLVAQDTCGDAHQIEARLQAHAAEQIFAAAGEPAALTLRLAFMRRGRAIAGRLSLELGVSSAEEVREIVGSSCAEVVEALVLVGLVLIEDAAPSLPRAAARSPTPPRKTETAGAPGPLAPTTSPPKLDALRARMLVALAGAFVAGQLPGAAGRAQLGGGLELVRGGGTVLASARLLAAFSDAGHVKIATQRSTFWSIAGRLELAGPRLSFRTFGVDAAGLFEFGRLQASVRRTAAASMGHAQWLAAGGLVRAFVSLHRFARLELEFGVFARLRSAEFRFERADGSLGGVWRIPAWGLQTAIGIALPFL